MIQSQERRPASKHREAGQLPREADGDIASMPAAKSGAPAWRTWPPTLPVLAPVRRDGPIILMYHQVADLARDPWGLAVSPRHFAEQLEVLAARRRPVSLQTLSGALRTHRLDPLQAVITFDDGYLDNLTHAKPILEQFDMPATVFVVGSEVGQDREFWWDEIDRLLIGDHPLPSELQLRVAGRDYTWTLRGARDLSLRGRLRTTSRESLRRWLWQRLRALPGEERWHIIETVRTWSMQPEAIRPEYRVMSVEDVRQLAAGGLVEVGAHTATHPRLAALPHEEQFSEIRQGKERLEEILEEPVTSFAYPFGGRFDVSAVSVDAVRRAGFARACTTRPGAVQPSTNPLRLPRLYVGNWTGDEFQRRLAPWL